MEEVRGLSASRDLTEGQMAAFSCRLISQATHTSCRSNLNIFNPVAPEATACYFVLIYEQ